MDLLPNLDHPVSEDRRNSVTGCSLLLVGGMLVSEFFLTGVAPHTALSCSHSPQAGGGVDATVL